MGPYARQIGFEAKDVGCDRAGAAIVRGVSFRLAPGDALQLFGPNGSGKSSLLSTFAGLIQPVEGELRWSDGGNTSAIIPAKAALFLGHDASVKPSLTARENLLFWAKCYGASADCVDTALGHVGATAFADLRAGRLSAGQKRRVDLARCLIAERPVWLLDEPTAAIDSEGVEFIGEMISRHRKLGGIAIIATHDELGTGFFRLELGR